MSVPGPMLLKASSLPIQFAALLTSSSCLPECSCFGKPSPTANPADVCSSELSNTLTYTQVGGIIFGQLTIGFLCDRIGRKWCSVLNAAIMLVCESQMCHASPCAHGVTCFETHFPPSPRRSQHFAHTSPPLSSPLQSAS